MPRRGLRLRPWAAEPMRRVRLEARLMRPLRRRRFRAFGSKSIVHRPDWVYGPQMIEIGAGVIVLGHIWLSAELPTWEHGEATIKIGDGVCIRPYCTLSAADSIEIEDNVVLSAFTTVVDSNHTFDGESENVLWNPITSAPIRIGRGTWVGERVGVLAGARIGRFCLVGANSVVNGEIPDYSIAVGSPARVVGSTRDSVAVHHAITHGRG
jgi:acetyltransferase-like isoleucine patch superfamily enzyme